MVMDGNGEDSLGACLADDILVKLFFDGARGGDVVKLALGGATTAFFLVDDRLAQFDAFAADVDFSGSFDEWADIAMALSTEGAVGIAVLGRATGASAGTAQVFRCHAQSSGLLQI